MGTVVERTPYDVWFHISTFIPRDSVKTLYRVNRSFLKIATGARYGVLTFSKRDKHMKWLLQNLSDPCRGALVHEITIEPWLVQPTLKPSHKWGASLWAFICGLFDPKFADRQLEQRVQKKVKKDIQRVIDAISAMPNLYKYSLRWQDNRSYHPELYRAFLAPVLARVKLNLRSLSLNVPPEMLHTLPSIALPHLESLSVDFCTKQKSEEEIDRIFDSFVVFLHNLGRLKSLSISSRVPSQSLKFDRFFSMLETLPGLQSFSFSIPFDGVHLSSPAGVVRFLNKHRDKLKHLGLSTSRCQPVGSPADPESRFWIRNILTSLKTPYPQLHDLDLAIRPIQVDLSPWLNFLELHRLTSLTLTERGLTYSEVKDILDALVPHEYPPGIGQLHLRLKHLSPALIKLFATRIPRLVLLELSFGEIATSLPAHSNEEKIRLFANEIKENRGSYAPWELVTLKLFSESPNIRVKGLLKVFADCVPAIQNHVDLTPDLNS